MKTLIRSTRQWIDPPSDVHSKDTDDNIMLHELPSTTKTPPAGAGGAFSVMDDPIHQMDQATSMYSPIGYLTLMCAR